MNNNKQLVFVYGTLKHGHSNHLYFLKDAVYVADATTKNDSYQMFSHGSFPVVIDCIHGVHNKISGEIYQVDDDIFVGLDMLEGNGKLYTRKEHRFVLSDTNEEVTAWVYLYNLYYRPEYNKTLLKEKLYVEKVVDKDGKSLLSWNNNQEEKENNNMENTNNQNRVQFYYVQDLNEPLRVLTLATQKVKQDVFRVTYAVNTVRLARRTQKYKDVDGLVAQTHVETIMHDPFNKALARSITSERLANNEKVVTVNIEDQRLSVKTNILKALAGCTELPSTVTRICNEEYEEQTYWLDGLTNESEVTW